MSWVRGQGRGSAAALSLSWETVCLVRGAPGRAGRERPAGRAVGQSAHTCACEA